MNSHNDPSLPHQQDVARHDEHAPPVSPSTSSFLRDIPLPLDEPVPTRVGGYRILRVLGQGGMGTVYEAEQEATRRFVALKVIHPHLATPRYRRRFVEEIRTLGKFEHPGIARIHDAGAAPDDTGAVRLFFAMELVAGLRVDEHVASQGTGRAEGAAIGSVSLIASLMTTICDAVHHAHQKGVIHCDLKPANILVGADGAPRILDFGIARIVGDEVRETAISHTGDHAGVLGTLAFASPEQGAGDRNGLDVLTDVYGLGAVMYALLAGTAPHDTAGCSLAEAARVVCDVPPVRVRMLRPGCPDDLETIVAKAMAPMSRDRYDSAAAMAADLRRFIEGRPIMARPAPWHEVALKWMRRNRLASTSIAAAALAAVVGIIGISLAIAKVNAALVRVLAAQSEHAVTHSAMQGSQLTTDSSHQRSTVFTEHLHSDEMPGYAGRVLMAMQWRENSRPGRGQGHLFAFDARGDIVDRLDAPRAWPVWARPRFDVGRRFERSLGVPQPSDTAVALVANLDADPARELVRGLKIQNSHLHLALLEIAEVTAVVGARGASPAGAGQLWSQGDFAHVVWDESRHLLWCLSISNELHYFVPELAGWDSARCPGGFDAPRMLVALDAADLCAANGARGMHRVMPPLEGDAAHPPVKPRWAFTTRTPPEMRGDAVAAAVPGPNEHQKDLNSGVVRLQIQSFEPYAVEEDRGLGKLYVALRHAAATPDLILSVELDAKGAPSGPFEMEETPHQGVYERSRLLAARLDPAEELLAIDLGALSLAWPRAERLLRELGGRDAALNAIDAMPHLAANERTSISRCIEAMTSNWRWLLNSAGETVESEGIVERLGAPGDVGLSEQSAAEIALAIDRLVEAAKLHGTRCPYHGNGFCVCEWFIESRFALALASAGEWAPCAESAQRAIELHERHPVNLGPDNPVDYAILAIALAGLGQPSEALDTLARAEQEELRLLDARARLAATSPSTSHQGSVDELAPRLLARARVLIRGH